MRNFLDELKGTRKLTPLLVCGAARSGTRMATDLLNKHERIAVQGEMHGETFDAFLQLVKSVDKTFDKHSARKGRPLDKSWQSAKAQLLHAYLATANKRPAIGHGKDLLFHGIKTPGYERFFRDFDGIFSNTPPYAVYCLRSVDRVWRSWVSLGYLDDVEVFRRRYERSLRLAGAMKRRAGERFILFDLDEYVACEDKPDWVARNLYGRLGLEDGDQYRELIAGAENRNALERTGTAAVRSEKVEQEAAMLLELPSIRKHRLAMGASEVPAKRKPRPDPA